MTRLVLVSLWVLVLVSACSPGQPVVGQAQLVDADGTFDPPPGPTIEVDPKGTPSVPAKLSGTVRLAIDGDTPYQKVLEVLAQVKAAGGKPVALVAHREHMAAMAFPPVGSNEADTIRVETRSDGKACVSPPGVEERTCVARKDTKHIDRAFVRQILFKAVREYHLNKVHVVVPDTALPWADVVRAVDGARTCCEEKDAVQVTIEP